MKNIILSFAFALICPIIFSQTITDAVSNKVFLVCHSDGSPMLIPGNEYIFISIHSNNSTKAFTGETLTKAAAKGTFADTGGWYANQLFLGITWKSNPNETSMYSKISGTNNFKEVNGETILKNVFSF
jgi:hypothetical protein